MRAIVQGGAQAAAAVIARLGGDSRTFGPPRGVCASRDEGWDAGRVRITGASHWLRRSPPVSLYPELHPSFTRDLIRDSPETYLVELPHGRSVGQFGLVISRDDRIVADLCPRIGGTPGIFPELRRLRLPTPKHVPGRVGVLGGSGGDGYFHWLYDVFPKLAMIRGADLEPDLWAVGNLDLPFVRESMDAVGVSDERVIAAGPRTHIEADTLIVASLPGRIGNPPEWVVAFLRGVFLPSEGPDIARGRRLYISRRDTRRRSVINDREVEGMLQARGFQTVVPSLHSVRDQAALFHAADVIVAPHGAALSNLAFCRPGTTVVELFAPEYVNVCYWSISNLVGMRYLYLVGTETNSPSRVGRDPDAAGIHVPLDALAATLDLALAP